MDSDPLRARFVQAVREGRGWAEIWELLANDPWYQFELKQWAEATVVRKGAPRDWRDDVRQEALILMGRDLRHRRDLGLDLQRAAESFAPWLRTIIIRHCVQSLRTLRKHERELPLPTTAAAPDVTVSDAALDRRIDIAAALDQIDEPERSAVILHGEHFTNEEIAAALGLSYWQAHGACRRGLQRLQSLLARSYKEDSRGD